jgi:hypothetical protein
MYIYVLILILALVLLLSSEKSSKCAFIENNAIPNTLINVPLAKPSKCVRLKGTILTTDALIVGNGASAEWTSPQVYRGNAIGYNYVVITDPNDPISYVSNTAFDLTFNFATPITEFEYYAD